MKNYEYDNAKKVENFDEPKLLHGGKIKLDNDEMTGLDQLLVMASRAIAEEEARLFDEADTSYVHFDANYYKKRQKVIDGVGTTNKSN